MDVDKLANFIRGVGGKHEMGAGELAERIVEWAASEGKTQQAAGSVEAERAVRDVQAQHLGQPDGGVAS